MPRMPAGPRRPRLRPGDALRPLRSRPLQRAARDGVLRLPRGQDRSRLRPGGLLVAWPGLRAELCRRRRGPVDPALRFDRLYGVRSGAVHGPPADGALQELPAGIHRPRPRYATLHTLSRLEHSCLMSPLFSVPHFFAVGCRCADPDTPCVLCRPNSYAPNWGTRGDCELCQDATRLCRPPCPELETTRCPWGGGHGDISHRCPGEHDRLMLLSQLPFHVVLCCRPVPGPDDVRDGGRAVLRSGHG